MVDNEPGTPSYSSIDGGMADGAGDAFSGEALVSPASSSYTPAATFSGVTHSAPPLSTVSSVPTSDNRSEVISQCFRKIGISSSEATVDVAAM